MNLTTRKYCLVTPARNEEKFISATANSVVSQVLPPVKWVVVSDGSTDRTDEIIESFQSCFPFIQLVRLPGDKVRNFGSQVRAIARGVAECAGVKYDYIGNLDADVSFAPEYYEQIILRFERDPQLGLAGGFIHEQKNGKGEFADQGFNTTRSVAHAIQLFRRECFESIGGYRILRFGGADTVAEEMARMKGWGVRSFPDLAVKHHKPILTGEGFLRGAFRQGQMDHAMGTHPVFELLRCAKRIYFRRFGIYSIYRMAGFLWQAVRFQKYDVPDDFVKYLRREQLKRMICTLRN